MDLPNYKIKWLIFGTSTLICVIGNFTQTILIRTHKKVICLNSQIFLNPTHSYNRLFQIFKSILLIMDIRNV